MPAVGRARVARRATSPAARISVRVVGRIHQPAARDRVRSPHVDRPAASQRLKRPSRSRTNCLVARWQTRASCAATCGAIFRIHSRLRVFRIKSPDRQRGALLNHASRTSAPKLPLHESTREKLQEMLKSSPQDPFLHYGLAMEHRKAGDLGSALAGLADAIACDANYVAAYFHRGQILAEQGNARSRPADSARRDRDRPPHRRRPRRRRNDRPARLPVAVGWAVPTTAADARCDDAWSQVWWAEPTLHDLPHGARQPPHPLADPLRQSARRS